MEKQEEGGGEGGAGSRIESELRRKSLPRQKLHQRVTWETEERKPLDDEKEKEKKKTNH